MQPGRDVHHLRLGRLVQIFHQPGGNVHALEQLDHPLGRAVPLAEQHDRLVLGEPALDVVERLPGVAPVGLGVLRGAVSIPRRRTAPSSTTAAPAVGVVADLLQRAERGRAQVDRRLAARRRVDPGRLQELLRGADELLGPAPDPLGVADEHRRPGRAGGRVSRSISPARTGANASMPSTGVPSASWSSTSASAGCSSASSRARSRTSAVSSSSRQGGANSPSVRRLQRALVGHLEPADLLDRVAPELQPQRVLLGRREHVEQPAAHRDLAPLLHHVDPVVAVVDEVGDDPVEVGVVAGLAAGSAPGRPGPCTIGWSSARTGATTT